MKRGNFAQTKRITDNFENERNISQREWILLQWELKVSKSYHSVTNNFEKFELDRGWSFRKLDQNLNTLQMAENLIITESASYQNMINFIKIQNYSKLIGVFSFIDEYTHTLYSIGQNRPAEKKEWFQNWAFLPFLLIQIHSKFSINLHLPTAEFIITRQKILCNKMKCELVDL